MAIVLRTPGVYREEVSLFPPSVAQVATAIPAFVGYTEKASHRGEALKNKPTRIRSIADFHERFGRGPDVSVTEILLVGNDVSEVRLDTQFYLYDSIRLFFANGGGLCYIVSVGDYSASASAAILTAGLDEVAREDEPTILVFPDAIGIESNQFYDVQTAALRQCGKLQDRFAILDLLERKDGGDQDLDTSVLDFRTRIGMQNLKYGAAYVPHLKTTLPKTVTFRSIQGKLTRLGATLSVKNGQLVDDPEVKEAAARAGDAIADADAVDGHIKQFVSANSGGSNDIDEMSKVHSAARDALRDKLGLLRSGTATASKLTAAAAAYRVLFETTYKLIQAVIDEVAKPDNDATIKTVEVRDFARKLITDALNASVKRLNTLTVKADKQVGWGTNNDSLYENFSVTAEEWTDAFADDLAELPEADVRTVFPEDPERAGLSVSGTRLAFGANMEAAAEEAATIFRHVEQAASSIKREAEQTERKTSEALLDAAPLLRTIIDRVANEQTTVPPSGVVAGIYCQVDRTRGVHKAPANVSVNNAEVVRVISHEEQGDLNIDSRAGKSINAIRPFVGRGTLVWGARTLDGNSNEWRYVSVRRFFNMVEESTKNASERFVFEPNDRNTWVKVRGMIENFLLIQWRGGALQGATPEQAFFVKVGLGETMTQLDINEGRMIVEIGMAVVRPAEFIILRFSHKMIES